MSIQTLKLPYALAVTKRQRMAGASPAGANDGGTKH
jgi:hypothetical protein